MKASPPPTSNERCHILLPQGAGDGGKSRPDRRPSRGTRGEAHDEGFPRMQSFPSALGCCAVADPTRRSVPVQSILRILKDVRAELDCVLTAEPVQPNPFFTHCAQLLSVCPAVPAPSAPAPPSNRVCSESLYKNRGRLAVWGGETGRDRRHSPSREGTSEAGSSSLSFGSADRSPNRRSGFLHRSAQRVVLFPKSGDEPARWSRSLTSLRA